MILILLVSSLVFSVSLKSVVFAQEEPSFEENLEETRNIGRCMTPLMINKYLASIQSSINGNRNLEVYALGDGSISIRFDSSFPVDRRDYVQDLFSVVYPEIIEVYGFPSNTLTISIKFDPTIWPWNYYDPANDMMALSDLPPTTGNNPILDNIFTHELIHAFHDAIYIMPESSWAEEGMAEATTEIVAMRLKDKGIRDMVFRDMIVNLKYYDVWSYTKDLLGGTQYFFFKTDPDISYRSAAAMFLILSNELATDPSQPYDFLSRLNSRLYQTGSTYIHDHTFKTIVRSISGGALVEGKYADEWFGNQPITKTVGSSGKFLSIFPVKPESPSQIVVYTFRRELNGPYKVEEPISNIPVNVKIYDHTGTIVTDFSVSTNQLGVGEISVSPYPLPSGGYEIFASTTIEGDYIESKNYAFSKGQSWSIEGVDQNIYGVTLDFNGSPIQSIIDIDGGTLQSVENGGFILRAEGIFVPYKITLSTDGYEKSIGKPNPYTRIVWTFATPSEPPIEPPPETYSVLVSILGLPPQYETDLFVDSNYNKTLKGGDTDTLIFDGGTSHTISVKQYINVSSEDRYHCTQNLITVSFEISIDFRYSMEYLVAFDHNIPNVSLGIQVDDPLKGDETKNYTLPASFWWEEGTVHDFVYPDSVNATEGLRYLLNYTSVSSPLVVNSSIRITGYYFKQYFLNISTEPPGVTNIQGMGYYNDGKVISLSAPEVESYNFRQWKIDGSIIPGNPISVEMDTPHKAVAEYESTGSYDITINAYSRGRGVEISIAFTFDGASYTTPYTFNNIVGTHTVVMPSQDDTGDDFLRWSDSNSTSPIRLISSGGAYQAEYGSIGRDFKLIVNPMHQRIGPGSSATYKLSLYSLEGFDSQVSFSIAGLPFNSTAIFEPPNIMPPGDVILRVDTSRAALVGHYLMVVTAFGEGRVHSVEVELSLGACVIATATFESELSPEVSLLRHFRDEYAMKTFAGEQFMQVFNAWYYSFSPYLADNISKNFALKAFTKIILYPLIFALRSSSLVFDNLSFNNELAIFITGFISSSLIGIMYLVPILLIFSLFLYDFNARRFLKMTSICSFSVLMFSTVLTLSAEVLMINGMMMFASVIFVLSSIALSSSLIAFLLMEPLRFTECKLALMYRFFFKK